MLDFVKAKLAAGAQPWQSALEQAQRSNVGRLDYAPSPHVVVECGPYSNPDIGCSDEKRDVVAAYTQALLWFYTGNVEYARKAVQIMDAWSAALCAHTGSNAPLQSAWAAEVFPRAAEIIRYTYSGWPVQNRERFAHMLRDVYLPRVIGGSAANGNWETSMIEAMLNIAVFTDDRATFERGLAMWRQRVPAYLYLSSDGPVPVSPPPQRLRRGRSLASYWYGQTRLVDGVSQETCRDLHHVQYGLAGIINAAETALIQGVDLYGEQARRIEAALELHAEYLNGGAVPGWLCHGALRKGDPDPMWEIAYNHYALRRGVALPEVAKLLPRIRPTDTDHHMVWETLTHAGLGATGLSRAR